MGMVFNSDELVSRKDYLKKKNKEKRIKRLKGMSTPTRILIAIIFVLGVYVVFQFSEYNKKHRLIQTLPDEISSLKDFNIYYVSQGYGYEPENSLKYMSTMSSDKTTLKEGKGISQISVSEGIVYGIKDGSLIRIDEQGKSEVLVKSSVQKYTVHDQKVYVYLTGEGIEPGIYSLEKKNKTKKLISGNINQILVDNNNIFVVDSSRQIVKYNKDGSNSKVMTKGEQSSYIIQDDKRIYFVNKSDSNKIYSLNKDDGTIKAISASSGIADSDNFAFADGSQYMGAYEDYLYFMNASDSNKLYKAKIDGTGETKLLSDKIQILDSIYATIFYKVEGDIGVYRYDALSGISSQVTSARILEFKVSE